VNTVNTRAGYVAIVGRPNVGKSTLMNALIEQKVSITSRKPQTTRHHILGIKTLSETQILFVDTPGIHSNQKRAINRYMNRAAQSVIADVDVTVMLVDRHIFTADDEMILERIQKSGCHLILAINKVDRIRQQQEILPIIAALKERVGNRNIVPISASRKENLDALLGVIESSLPASPFYFPPEEVTDRSEKFLVAELVREKLMRQFGEELPYATTIQLERFEAQAKVIQIDATIFVERMGQRAILIGAGGNKLKRVGIDARRDIEKLLDHQVMLRLWVKVKRGWSDDERALRSLGYGEE
jgi:GTP-binding protein Era|tara:strand:+ start:1485 stop:2384 length:900 start_codon:yes stop_codon:yes gene_type:complete